MPTTKKIKIIDNDEIREKIDDLYDDSEQVILAKWAVEVAKHILKICGIDYMEVDAIVEGFKVNELWREGKARMHDVRQAGFKIHRLAKESHSKLEEAALRATGQAVASGHMREHAMVASDYAIKAIGLKTSNDITHITRERQWQYEELQRLCRKDS